MPQEIFWEENLEKRKLLSFMYKAYTQKQATLLADLSHPR
jgi:hypothetical protein